MKDYKEYDYLMLSGLQHFVFCRRQWALIHIEQDWEENVLTIEGNVLHERVDNPSIREKRGNSIFVRAMPIHSAALGISGICDMVEFVKDENGINIYGEEDLFVPRLVEYKRGRPKTHNADIIQLVAQVICLEEMLVTDIDEATLFYNEVKRRQKISITEALRDEVRQLIKEMHLYYKRRHTPRVKTGKHCASCSLRNICLPKLMNREKVSTYMDRMLEK